MRGEISYSGDVRSLPLEELRIEARTQELSYSRGEPHHDQAGLELFRRAIADQDDDAWQAIIDIYRGLLTAQATRLLVRKMVDEDDGFCVDRAFQRFWQAARAGRLRRCEDLASILKYLKLCLSSVLLDQARVRRRKAWLALDDVPPHACVTPDPTTQVVDGMARRELWRAVAAELPDPKERLVAELSFVAGLTPLDIVARCPEQFENAFEVYRTKRTMIERLRRSRAIQRLLCGDGEGGVAAAD